MKYVVFDSEPEATVANDAITQSMGFSGDITEKWSQPRQMEDGKWVLVEPPIDHDYLVAEYFDGKWVLVEPPIDHDYLVAGYF
jgi:hypothetical protein